ncbi:uncharacterized protein LOC116614686 [Nematostella vectensis]|uniref:uncharacterized protein LOC116614686 n=1 Tax=Nematostella vectensis TaxID=45351 RepID=UPI0020772569|nr:uncharacterized protein LOC116614686 [Nematostella vectensis]
MPGPTPPVLGSPEAIQGFLVSAQEWAIHRQEQLLHVLRENAYARRFRRYRAQHPVLASLVALLMTIVSPPAIVCGTVVGCFALCALLVVCTVGGFMLFCWLAMVLFASIGPLTVLGYFLFHGFLLYRLVLFTLWLKRRAAIQITVWIRSASPFIDQCETHLKNRRQETLKVVLRAKEILTNSAVTSYHSGLLNNITNRLQTIQSRLNLPGALATREMIASVLTYPKLIVDKLNAQVKVTKEIIDGATASSTEYLRQCYAQIVRDMHLTVRLLALIRRRLLALISAATPSTRQDMATQPDRMDVMTREEIVRAFAPSARLQPYTTWSPRTSALHCYNWRALALNSDIDSDGEPVEWEIEEESVLTSPECSDSDGSGDDEQPQEPAISSPLVTAVAEAGITAKTADQRKARD